MSARSTPWGAFAGGLVAAMLLTGCTQTLLVPASEVPRLARERNSYGTVAVEGVDGVRSYIPADFTSLSVVPRAGTVLMASPDAPGVAVAVPRHQRAAREESGWEVMPPTLPIPLDAEMDGPDLLVTLPPRASGSRTRKLTFRAADLDGVGVRAPDPTATAAAKTVGITAGVAVGVAVVVVGAIAAVAVSEGNFGP